jgi:hypothetical protein
MPTIEFYGIGSDEQTRLKRHLREKLSQDDFREDCVFVTAARSEVVDWQGRSRPFIRVSTRSAGRGQRFRDVLYGVCDLEIVRIEFHPQLNESGD